MSAEVLGLGAREVATLLRNRVVRSQEVAQACLDRIGEAAALNAIAHLDADQVMTWAADADRRLMTGEDLPLLGVPFSVKDSIAVEGWPWRSGSFARAAVVADADATAVARLRALGAIPLCKTTTPEYTWSAQTSSALHGYTNNPYDLGRSTGGSSGGEAALHAVHAAPFGLGTDGFCSIRLPAHFCGSAGLRPTAGIVSEAGTWPLTRATGMMDISTTGPMAAHAADLGYLLTLIAGADPADPFAHPLGQSADPPEDLKHLVVGVLCAEAVGAVTPGTRRALDSAAAFLAAAGARVVELPGWRTDDAVELAFELMAPDGGLGAGQRLAAAQGRHTPEFAGLLASLGERRLTIDAYLAAVERWAALRRQVRESFGAVTVALAPVATGPAPLHDGMPGDDTAESSVVAFNHSFAIAMAGVPSAVVPVTMEGGLPVGVQVLAAPHHDRVAAHLAATIQSHFARDITAPSAWQNSKETP